MRRLLLWSLLVLAATEPAFAQAKRKVRKDSDASAAPKTEGHGSGLLPDWPTSDFDWFAGPVFGFKYSDVSSDDQPRTKTTTLEGGLMAGLSGVPVVPGNPGFQVAPDVGAAYGYVFSRSEGQGGTEKSSGHYQRQWIGSAQTVYAHWFRYRLDLRYGRLTPKEEPDAMVQSVKVGNDFGVLILPWLSEHYTLDYLRASSKHHTLLKDYNHWLHTRMFFSLMSFVLDFGPGFTQTTEYDAFSGAELAKGHVDYFLLKFGLNPFWKFVADGQAKYVYRSSEEKLGAYATTRLPEDDLNEPNTLALPEDSFLGSLFLGVKDLFYGVGAGWRQNVQVLHVRRQDDAPKQTTKDQGFGLYYEVRF